MDAKTLLSQLKPKNCEAKEAHMINKRNIGGDDSRNGDTEGQGAPMLYKSEGAASGLPI
jgi:hypothetical protein